MADLRFSRWQLAARTTLDFQIWRFYFCIEVVVRHLLKQFREGVSVSFELVLTDFQDIGCCHLGLCNFHFCNLTPKSFPFTSSWIDSLVLQLEHLLHLIAWTGKVYSECKTPILSPDDPKTQGYMIEETAHLPTRNINDYFAFRLMGCAHDCETNYTLQKCDCMVMRSISSIARTESLATYGTVAVPRLVSIGPVVFIVWRYPEYSIGIVLTCMHTIRTL
jgi:hypothetical protein